jgi:hypothetical protein
VLVTIVGVVVMMVVVVSGGGGVAGVSCRGRKIGALLARHPLGGESALRVLDAVVVVGVGVDVGVGVGVGATVEQGGGTIKALSVSEIAVRTMCA